MQDFRRSGIAGMKHPFQTTVVDDSTKFHAFVVGHTVTLFRLNNAKKWTGVMKLSSWSLYEQYRVD